MTYDFSRAPYIPVIRLWNHLLVSLQGDIGDHQAQQLSHELLEHVRRAHAESLVIDVSGVAVIDSHLCSILAGIAAAASFMGVRSIVCGLSAEVVMTLVTMGIELDGIETRLSLEDALESLGIGPWRVAEEPATGPTEEPEDGRQSERSQS